MVRFLRIPFAPLAVLLLALSAASPAAAETPVATESTAAATAEAEAEAPPAPMSVEFPRRRASVVGARAVVFVQCSGLVSEICEGTLVLSGVGGAHKVPFMIERGERQALAIPLGDGSRVDRGCRARVVARTLQLTGSTVRTASFLRLR